ncbi:DUF5998 family protein [Propionibacteriaceae bacterium G1746]|uniref:DUF5998 family protein n=1 Tax=Aestuariimicrobium sp. G57 TaxID=3418485 RepID=UPI003C27C3E3
MHVQPNTHHLPEPLATAIQDCGFFPAIVQDSIAMALAGEPVVAHLVHHEPTFVGDEVHRHLSVMVITPTRLLVGHTDESSDNPTGKVQAITSTESIALGRINSVNMTRVVADPASANGTLVETWLTIGWGTMNRIELEPAHCADPNCEADHGLSGSLVADDLTVRMSPAADGAESVAALITFGGALQLAAAGVAR